MEFRPIDEFSLRHLFSTAYAKDILHLSYIGPVLNPANVIETSPDCMILDRRSHPFKSLRCEFKFTPFSKDDFSHNGQFDIAIIWSLPKGHSKDKLINELLEQNGCAELIVLEDFKEFRELPTYTLESLSRLGSSDIIRNLAIRRKLPPVFALCMAAKLYPEKFHIDRMMEFLSKRFPIVKKMKPQGRSNVISAFLMSKPPLLKLMHGKYYSWNSDFDSVIGTAVLTELITANFGDQAPSSDDLKLVCD